MQKLLWPCETRVTLNEHYDMSVQKSAVPLAVSSMVFTFFLRCVQWQQQALRVPVEAFDETWLPGLTVAVQHKPRLVNIHAGFLLR